MNLNTKSLIVAAVAATPIFFWSAGAAAAAPTPNISALQQLGRALFFDEISIPGNKQSCASCHSPEKGWILPDSTVNAGRVAAPGAKPHTEGGIKPPASAYSTLSPPLRVNTAIVPIGLEGGNFWNGRATGLGKNGADFVCERGQSTSLGVTVGCVEGVASRTIKPSDIPFKDYEQFLGPTTDQALNPFTPGGNEQNIREKNVCQRVKTAPYKALYKAAYGVDIDCSPDPQLPEGQRAYNKSFKLIALAIGAWQHSLNEVNQFSSRVDDEIAVNAAFGRKPDGSGQVLTKQEMDGHDLFYSTFFNPIVRAGRIIATNCSLCHNSGTPATDVHELYTDFGYHNIGLPYNPELAGGAVPKGADKGLGSFLTSSPLGTNPDGHFKTPTMRNVGTGVEGGFIKAYGHNGYFKSLERLVHFYNTSNVGGNTAKGFGITRCSGDLTDLQAKAANCWPAPEFPDTAAQNLVLPNNRSLIGDMGMNTDEEAALVAYMKALSDAKPPVKKSQ